MSQHPRKGHFQEVSEHGLVYGWFNCGPRGGTQGVEPDSRVQRFWGPFRGLGIQPLVSAIRSLGNPLPERCVRFQRSGEKRWATERPLRGPVFPDAP